MTSSKPRVVFMKGNFENPLTQKFPFNFSMMDYIYKSVKPVHLEKLYKTCKFFYAKYSLTLMKYTYIEKNCDPYLKYGKYMKAFSKLKNVWLYNELALGRFTSMPVLRSRCYRVDLEMLDIYNTKLEYDELKFLMESETISNLIISNCNLTHTDGSRVALEDVVKFVPKIKKLRISCIHTTAKTMDLLLSIKFQNEITLFRLEAVDFYLDPGLFFDFLNKYATDKCDFSVEYNNQQMTHKFTQNLYINLTLNSDKENEDDCQKFQIGSERILRLQSFDDQEGTPLILYQHFSTFGQIKYVVKYYWEDASDNCYFVVFQNSDDCLNAFKVSDQPINGKYYNIRPSNIYVNRQLRVYFKSRPPNIHPIFFQVNQIFSEFGKMENPWPYKYSKYDEERFFTFESSEAVDQILEENIYEILECDVFVERDNFEFSYHDTVFNDEFPNGIMYEDYLEEKHGIPKVTKVDIVKY